MSGNLFTIVRILVDNLQYTYAPRVVEEIAKQQIPRTRGLAGKTTGKKTDLGQEQTFRDAKRTLLSMAISGTEQTELVLSLPEWLGFKLAETQLTAADLGPETASRDAAISILWLTSIPRNAISTIAGPDEFRKESIDLLIRYLLESDVSRDSFVEAMKTEMDRRGIDPSTFDVRNSLSGYKTDDSQARSRTPALLALTMIVSTGLPFDLDCVLKQDAEQIIRVTAGYIMVYHVMRFLRTLIAGETRSKPFDWPMVGERRTLNRISVALDLLQATLADTKCCMLFAEGSTSQDTSIGARVVSIFLDELIEYYSDTFKSRKGKGVGDDLANFVDLLRREKLEISKRVWESGDKGQALLNELMVAKNKAKVGFKQYASPERLYADSLSLLEVRLRVRSRGENFDTSLADELKPVFESIGQITQKNKERLGDDKDRFVESLCFETCFRILDYLGLGEYLMDLPWVSRFMAEDCVKERRALSMKDRIKTEHRGERIVAAYEAGLIYLVLQTFQPTGS